MKKLLLPLFFASQVVSAELVLDNDASQLNFGSIKNNSVAELHRFTTLSGAVDDDGNATIEVDLSSVDTQIGIRDKRMKKHLFQIPQFPLATFTAELDLADIEKIGVGENQQYLLQGELDLHGKKVPLDILTRVSKGADGAYAVYSVEPAFLKVDDFDLGAGVDKLKELAGLESIARAVPVTFSVVFREKTAEDEEPEEESPLEKLLPF